MPQPPIPKVTLKQLHYFVVLSETRNFTRAAAQSFVTQSTLSASLKELEDALSAALVERDRQSVQLTPLGLQTVALARQILAQAADVADLAHAARAPMAGHLKVGAIPTIAPFVLPDLMARVRASYPELKLVLAEEQTAVLIERLEAGQLDAALLALPIDTGKLRLQPLYTDELWLAGLPGDPAVVAAHAKLGVEASTRLILLEEGHCLREHTLGACPKRVREANATEIGVEASSLLTLIHMADAGLGLALVPEMALQAGILKELRLIAKPFATPAPRRTIALVSRATSARGAELKALAGLLIAGKEARTQRVLSNRARRSYGKLVTQAGNA